jgi:hypothetical protein
LRRLVLHTLLFALLSAMGAGGFASAGAAVKQRVIVSPLPGQTVRSDLAAVRVRVGQANRVVVRLNGQLVTDQFGPRRRGARSLRASISQGLRRGVNRLTVTLRRGERGDVRVSRRFFVRPGGPMLGAGLDRIASTGQPLRLLGEVDAEAPPLRWSVIRAPRSGVPGRSRDEPARLLSPGGEGAILVPRVPGTYLVEVSAGPGEEKSDLVKIEAMPRNLLVPIDTFGGGDKLNERGIRVGRTIYKTSDAVNGDTISDLQVLVLDRDDLGFVSNTVYADELLFEAEMKKLNPGQLVIVALQPGNQSVEFNPLVLNKAVAPIGVPDFGNLPTRPGAWSAIGIPGLGRGLADVNVLPESSSQLGPLDGYLTRDQNENWGYVPARREAFAYEPKQKDVCQGGAACLDGIGFQVRFQNSRTLESQGGELFFNTGAGTLAAAEQAATAMAAALENAPFEAVVRINSVSGRLPGVDGYRAPLTPVSAAVAQRLAKAVALVGGTRNAFNKIALQNGSLASGGLTYALVGWQGAGEGHGAEAAAGVFGAGDAASLAGTLRPDSQSHMKPAAVTIAGNGPDFTDEVMTAPADRWPLEDDPGALRALRYLGSTQKALGSDPRSAYWIQPFGPARWDQLAASIEAVPFRRLPEAQRGRFTEDEFEEAQETLAREMRWVGNVREYVDNLANPFDQNIFKSWEAAQDIADEIYEEAHAGDSNVGVTWAQFVSIVLKLGGIVTFGVTTELGLMMDLGIWAAGTVPSGEPTDVETKVRADEVGTNLANELRGAAQTLERLADIVVSDPSKLKLVGIEAGCNAADPDCNQNYSFSAKAKRRVSADVARSVERYAYERLLPLGFHVFNLYPDHSSAAQGGKPRGAELYYCGATGTWDEFSPTALRYATASLLRQLDPITQANEWQVLVMSKPLGGGYHGTPPTDDLLRRLFSPLPGSKDPAVADPEAGGLNMSPEALLATSGWDDGRDNCHWTGP